MQQPNLIRTLMYSPVAIRWGDVYKLFELPCLLNFKKKNSDQNVFTPDLLDFQFILSENSYLIGQKFVG